MFDRVCFPEILWLAFGDGGMRLYVYRRVARDTSCLRSKEFLRFLILMNCSPVAPHISWLRSLCQTQSSSPVVVLVNITAEVRLCLIDLHGVVEQFSWSQVGWRWVLGPNGGGLPEGTPFVVIGLVSRCPGSITESRFVTYTCTQSGGLSPSLNRMSHVGYAAR